MSSASIAPLSTVNASFVPPVDQIESLPLPLLKEGEAAVHLKDAETFTASVNGHAQATIVFSDGSSR